MNAVPQNIPKLFESDLVMVRIARELAMELLPLNEILRRMSISDEQFRDISANPRFQQMLATEVANWHSATNTHERVKLKAAAMMEEALPEFFERMLDTKESLPAKVETAKMVTKLAGMGNERQAGEAREHFSLTINIGDGVQRTLNVSTPPKVIEHDEDDYEEPELTYEETFT